MKKLALYVGILGMLLCFSACAAPVQEQEPDAQTLPAGSGNNNKDALVFGVLKTPFEHFEVFEEIPREQWPTVFEQDGKYGYLDAQGNVLVAPIYDRCSPFWNGRGNARLTDENGNFHWQSFGVDGKALQFETMGFFGGMSLVRDGDMWGYVNQKDEVIVPLVYEKLVQRESTDPRIAYGMRDGCWVLIDLEEGCELRYEEYDESCKEQYSEVYTLPAEELCIVNMALTVQWEPDWCGQRIPAVLLEGRSFDLYEDNQFVGTAAAKIGQGMYEGEIACMLTGYSEDFSDRKIPDHFAVPAGVGRAVSLNPGEQENYRQAIASFLEQEGFDAQQWSFGAAVWEGALLPQGECALIEIEATRGDMTTSLPPLNLAAGPSTAVTALASVQQGPREFEIAVCQQTIDSKTIVSMLQALSDLLNPNYFCALLLIEDIENPQGYTVLSKTDMTQGQYHDRLIGVYDFNSDGVAELIISRGYYEAWDPVISSLSQFVQQ